MGQQCASVDHETRPMGMIPPFAHGSNARSTAAMIRRQSASLVAVEPGEPFLVGGARFGDGDHSSG
jgi:hypothetical protein